MTGFSRHPPVHSQRNRAAASPTPTWAPTTSSSARPIRPTGTGWYGNLSAWATRSPWSQQPPDRILDAGWSAPEVIFRSGWGRRFDSGGGLHQADDQHKRWSSSRSGPVRWGNEV